MRRLHLLASLLALLSGAALAQTGAPTLAVRPDSLRPGWFFVGVAPGIGREVPIDVEIRFGSEAAAPKVFRSPDPKSFDLCGVLKAAGHVNQSGVVFLTVRRGQATYVGRLAYDGSKGCSSAPPRAAATARPAAPAAGLLDHLRTLAPLSEATAAPTPASAASTAATPVTVVVAGSEVTRASEPAGASPTAAAPAEPKATTRRPVATPSETVARASEAPRPQITAAPLPTTLPQPPAEPVRALPPAPAPEQPAPTPPPPRLASPTPAPPTPPAPAASPVAATPAPAVTAPPAATAASVDQILTSEQRRLTASNFQSIEVFLKKDKANDTEDYQFVLTFKEPVDISGIEDAIIEDAAAQVRRRETFFDPGMTNPLEPVQDPKQTLKVEFTLPRGLAVSTPGVNQMVMLKIRLGDASFKGRTFVRRAPN